MTERGIERILQEEQDVAKVLEAIDEFLEAHEPTTYDELIQVAEVLGEMLSTDWADEHEDKYEAFDETIREAYAAGSITAAMFNNLATTAFYDYYDLIEEE